MNSANVAILILAAGSSSRLGQSKQLIKIDGTTLLEKSVQVAMEAGVNHTIVVLGAEASTHKKVIESFPVEVIINEEWEKGMGNSLKKGLRQLIKKYAETEAVIVMVCDQPFLTSVHLKKLIASYGKDRSEIVASSYNHINGVPAVFSHSLFDQLLTINDTEGARKIIQNYDGAFQSVEFEHGEIDIDTPEDLDKIKPRETLKKR